MKKKVIRIMLFAAFGLWLGCTDCDDLTLFVVKTFASLIILLACTRSLMRITDNL